MSEILTLFDRFGGTRKMADALGEPASTVQSWKSAGRVPAGKQPDVLAKAQELGLAVDAENIIFPLGRSDSPSNEILSATKEDDNFSRNIGLPYSADIPCENIADKEHARPFAQAPGVERSSGASARTFSQTSGLSSSSAASPTCSPDGEADAA
ncbi:MAG: hypothetical protein V4502_13190 [Pseudomonadota bacterium]